MYFSDKSAMKTNGFAKSPIERYASLRVCVLLHPLVPPTCQAEAPAKAEALGEGGLVTP
jgi:hypothetical protein